MFQQIADRLKSRRLQDRLLKLTVLILSIGMLVTFALVLSIHLTLHEFMQDRAASRLRSSARWEAIEKNQDTLASVLTGLRQELVLTDQAVKLNEKQLKVIAREHALTKQLSQDRARQQ